MAGWGRNSKSGIFQKINWIWKFWS